MRRAALLVLLGATACRQILGIEPGAVTEDASVDTDSTPPLPDCTVQRVVHLVGGSGGFAFFTLVWPAPRVITDFAAGYAYDNPIKAKSLGTVDHPLYARFLPASRAVWEGRGAAPQPTAMIAGTNETHTNSPSSFIQAVSPGLDVAAATLQAPLAPVIPVLAFENVGPYNASMGAPPLVRVDKLDAAISAFNGLVPTIVLQQLPPTSAQLATYLPLQGATLGETELATYLAFTANALRLGLVGTVLMPAVADDSSHAIFADGVATARADNLARILDAFYAELADAVEANCGRDGEPLSLADNVVMIVTGDTAKNSFDISTSWADGTPVNSNWVYVRSNGFLQPGWFGEIRPGVRTNWDPTTGALTSIEAQFSTRAAWAASLYAITRGNRAAVSALTPSAYDGALSD